VATSGAGAASGAGANLAAARPGYYLLVADSAGEPRHA